MEELKGKFDKSGLIEISRLSLESETPESLTKRASDPVLVKPRTFSEDKELLQNSI